ncbi:MAG: capsule assembly Wzi family protein [Candidatus Eiseniibacteriota bacterium]|jgi:hypothetical protein
MNQLPSRRFRSLVLVTVLVASGAGGAALAGPGNEPADPTGGRQAAADAPPSAPPVALTVASPIHEELAALAARGAIAWPGLQARPLSRTALARRVATLPAAGPASHRLRAELAPELHDLLHAGVHRRQALIELDGDDGRFRVEAFARFQAEAAPRRGFVRTDSTRAGLRCGLTVWPGFYVFQELYVADVEGGRAFADPLIADTDVILYEDRVYAALDTRYAELTFGRDRLAWGPGLSGGLLLSRTARPFTQLRVTSEFLDGRFAATIVNGVLSAVESRYVAFHRLDWQIHPRLRIGFAEGARYDSGLEPLYLVGIVPYTLVGRLLERDQDDRASDSRVRNNVIWDLDASWRAGDGTLLYGEFLLDDLGTADRDTPTRLAYQLGVLHVRTLAQRELRLRAEWTRVWRHVYSVFYGADFVHEGVPLGYPLGPDSRHVAVWADWVLDRAWTLGGTVVRQDRGESRLGDFWDPEDPAARDVDTGRLSGVVERQWHLLGRARYRPHRHLEALVEIGPAWVRNAAHVRGARARGLVGRVGVEIAY